MRVLMIQVSGKTLVIFHIKKSLLTIIEVYFGSVVVSYSAKMFAIKICHHELKSFMRFEVLTSCTLRSFSQMWRFF